MNNDSINGGFVDELDAHLFNNRHLHDFAEIEKPVINHDDNLQYWRTEVKATENGFCAVDLYIDKGKFGGRVEEKELCKFPHLAQCADYCFDHGRESVFIKTGINHEEIIKRG